jgi:hypothetical protein
MELDVSGYVVQNSNNTTVWISIINLITALAIFFVTNKNKTSSYTTECHVYMMETSDSQPYLQTAL